jgi:hypothetical protein
MTGMDSTMSPVRQETHPFQKKTDSGVGNHGGGLNLDRSDERDLEIDDEEDDSDSGEPTIVFSKLPHKSKSAAPSPIAIPLPPSRPHSQASTVELSTPIQANKHVPNRIDPLSTGTKIRRTRITPEMERVCVSHVGSLPSFVMFFLMWSPYRRRYGILYPIYLFPAIILDHLAKHLLMLRIPCQYISPNINKSYFPFLTLICVV